MLRAGIRRENRRRADALLGALGRPGHRGRHRGRHLPRPATRAPRAAPRGGRRPLPAAASVRGHHRQPRRRRALGRRPDEHPRRAPPRRRGHHRRRSPLQPPRARRGLRRLPAPAVGAERHGPPPRASSWSRTPSRRFPPSAHGLQVRVRNVRGFSIASWRSGGLVYELVSDMDEADLRRTLAGHRPDRRPRARRPGGGADAAAADAAHPAAESRPPADSRGVPELKFAQRRVRGRSLLAPPMPTHVLIVEGDTALSSRLRSALQQRGHTVEETTDGRGVIDLVRRRQPGAIVLAVELPGGQNGYLLVGKLKKDEGLKAIPVIIVGNPEGFEAHARLKNRAERVPAEAAGHPECGRRRGPTLRRVGGDPARAGGGGHRLRRSGPRPHRRRLRRRAQPPPAPVRAAPPPPPAPARKPAAPAPRAPTRPRPRTTSPSSPPRKVRRRSSRWYPVRRNGSAAPRGGGRLVLSPGYVDPAEDAQARAFAAEVQAVQQELGEPLAGVLEGSGEGDELLRLRSELSRRRAAGGGPARPARAGGAARARAKAELSRRDGQLKALQTRLDQTVQERRRLEQALQGGGQPDAEETRRACWRTQLAAAQQGPRAESRPCRGRGAPGPGHATSAPGQRRPSWRSCASNRPRRPPRRGVESLHARLAELEDETRKNRERRHPALRAAEGRGAGPGEGSQGRVGREPAPRRDPAPRRASRRGRRSSRCRERPRDGRAAVA